MSLDYRSDPPTERPVLPPEAPSYEAYDLSGTVLGTDRLALATPLERLVENVLDWEHLPFVHPENFCSAELLGQGPGWYRARFGSPPRSSGQFNEVLVAVHPAHDRWFLALETGTNAGLTFHSRATVIDRDHVVVDLTFLMRTPPRNRAVQRALFEVYRRKLRLLYGQDEVMASTRHRALLRFAARASDREWGEALGPLADVVAAAPFLILLRGQRFWVRVEDGVPEAFGADCPHMQGPLPCPGHDGAPEGDVVTCPWHGYRFDVTTGHRAQGGSLRLAPPPRLVVEDGVVVLKPPGAQP